MELSKQALSATKWEWKMGEQEFERLTNQLKRNLTSLYSAVKSSEKIRRLRAKSYKEIRKAFLQGRLDVFQLIQAKDFALQSEIKKAVFMTLYHESLTYALALQDQLIPFYIKKKPQNTSSTKKKTPTKKKTSTKKKTPTKKKTSPKKKTPTKKKEEPIMNTQQFSYIKEVLGISSVIQPKEIQSVYRLSEGFLNQTGPIDFLFFCDPITKSEEKNLLKKNGTGFIC